MNRKTRNILVGCGILAFIAGCIAILLALGGFGALAVIFGPDPEGLALDISLEPAVISQGESFQLVVAAGNIGTRPLTVSSVDLPSDLLAGALLTQVTPQEQGRAPLGDSLQVQFDRVIAPGEQVELVFVFNALNPGDYSGDLDVVVGLRRKNYPLRLVVNAPGAAPTPAVRLDTPNARLPVQSVVQISALFEEQGEYVQGWTGSGTIITPEGLILTNAHVVLPDRFFPVDALVVALTRQADRPPEPAYFAEVIQADPDLDIAVIRISSDLEGNALDPAALNLPAVALGNSDQLGLGDELYILGYPGIGGETITLTSGEVSGFTSEPERGDRAFIKTSATIAGGNSGGLAVNDDGEIIGVPTQLGYGGEDQFIDCRVLADTNRDGQIDDDDSCVPTGGFINALRPLALAMPLIEAARRGEVDLRPAAEDTGEVDPGGAVLFEDDFSDPGSGWDEGRETGYAVGYVDGEYRIELNDVQTFVWSVAGGSFEDVVIRVEARPFAPTGEGDFGVICRYQDNENYYALEVTEDGYFAIWKRVAGEFVPLIDWETSEVLPAELSQVQLTASCTGDRLSLAADEKLLAEVQDPSFAGGDVGLIAGTLETPGLIMAFDNYVVRAP